MKYLKGIIIICLFLTSVSKLTAQTQHTSLWSPNKQLEMKFISSGNRLYYTLSYRRQVILEPSPLGLLVNHQFIGAVTGIKIVKKTIINKTYPWRGVHSKAINHCNFTTISCYGLTDKFTIEAKIFNDGIAFRYIIAKQDSSTVNADSTGFVIPAGSVIWCQNDIAYYEGEYKRQNIEDAKAGQLAGPPLTVKLPDNSGYMAITEGGVTDFSGISLQAAGSNTFKANLVTATHLKGEIKTPWRIIEVSKNLTGLVNCDIVANVSPKPDQKLFPKGFDTPWIKPGECTWSWLAGNGDVTFDNMKRYADWAGQLGIPYNLVDDGWAKWYDDGKDQWTLLKELVDYSRKHRVKVWVWKAYPDRDGIPGIKDPKARWEFLNKCKTAGVAGIKIDFFNAESQEVINFYRDALKDAATLHLMLDFHGADKPTGQSYTWPNEMTREGIRGLEYGTSVPKDNTTLPFTRFLAGSADYTPLTLLKSMANGTTLSHQVATVITFTSPFMCLGVDPEKLLTSPARELVTQMPTTWDETIVLPQSAIGELSVYARRKGSVWYLAVVNGNQNKNVSISLSFLKNGTYHSLIMHDSTVATEQSEIIHKNYLNTDVIKLNLQNGGGFVARFTK